MSRTCGRWEEKGNGGLLGVSGSSGPEPSGPPGTACGLQVLLIRRPSYYLVVWSPEFSLRPLSLVDSAGRNVLARGHTVVVGKVVSCGPGGVLGYGLMAFVLPQQGLGTRSDA